MKPKVDQYTLPQQSLLPLGKMSSLWVCIWRKMPVLKEKTDKNICFIPRDRAYDLKCGHSPSWCQMFPEISRQDEGPSAAPAVGHFSPMLSFCTADCLIYVLTCGNQLFVTSLSKDFGGFEYVLVSARTALTPHITPSSSTRCSSSEGKVHTTQQIAAGRCVDQLFSRCSFCSRTLSWLVQFSWLLPPHNRFLCLNSVFYCFNRVWLHLTEVPCWDGSTFLFPSNGK